MGRSGGEGGSLWKGLLFWRRTGSPSSSSSSASSRSIRRQINASAVANPAHPPHASSSPSLVRSLIPARRRLRLDPRRNLYLPYEPGKQVKSAIRIKNTSKSHVAFKFQTTAPKSCFMRPSGGILSPGESIIATVFKFVEVPENNDKISDKKRKIKFKILSLKVKGGIEYVPELFEEEKDQIAAEQILRVVFLNAEHPSQALEKLKQRVAEAEAAIEARKKPPEDTGPRFVGEGLVIDEWKERRERHLARQQVEAADSL